LLAAFISIIGAMSIASLAFLALGVLVTQQYRSISDAMIAEYQLVDSAAVLIDAYNRRVQSAGAEVVAEYEQKRIQDALENIERLTTELDGLVLDTQSRSDYLGFKASIEKFTTHINDSLRRFEQSNIKDYFADFNEANKQYGFVRENGTMALFSQLKNANVLRDSIERAYRTSLWSGIGAFAVLVSVCVFFVFRFSRRFVAPLSALSAAAEKIAAGDTTVQIHESVGGGGVEIRSLERSFGAMVRQLLENVKKVDTSNKELAESSSVLTKQNEELGRLNGLMIDRELKMIELKKELERLKSSAPKQ
jgi:methyl-accepting chemotaxis protein